MEGTISCRHSGFIRKRREGEVGQGVNWAVRPDWGDGTGRLPVKRHDVRWQAGAEGPIGVRSPRHEERGEGPAEAGRCRVNGGRGTDEVEGRR